MKILILAIGKCKKKSPEAQLIAEYVKRSDWKVEIKEKDNASQEEEARFLQENIPHGAKVVVLDERGENMKSTALAAKFENWMLNGCSEICFLIGGADGPTAIYLTSHLLDGNLLFTLILGLTLFLNGAFCLIFKRAVINNCGLKTTALSLIISFFGASGLVCFFIWYSIVAFHEMSKHPLSYPLSIIGGMGSLVAFVSTIVFYVRARKENLKIKGIILDIITSIITLPTFFWLCAEIYNLLQ